VLLQKNEEGFEQPIYFFGTSMRDAKLRYDILEKQAYAMVKAIKYFRIYVIHSKIVTYVPTSTIKGILVQLDSYRKIVRWLAKIQEFDLEVKPTKLVKGQGLENLLAESNFRALGINHLESHKDLLDIEEFDDQTPTIQIQDKFASSSWYGNIFSYLLTLQFLNDMTSSKVRTLKLHVVKSIVLEGSYGFLVKLLNRI
jgi:hypothetical protein